MAITLPVSLIICLLLHRLWVQDGDPSRNSAMARAAMERANCHLVKIPQRSPDLNPIDNIFKLVTDILRKQAITLHRINKTIASMANRVDKIINRTLGPKATPRTSTRRWPYWSTSETSRSRDGVGWWPSPASPICCRRRLILASNHCLPCSV